MHRIATTYLICVTCVLVGFGFSQTDDVRKSREDVAELKERRLQLLSERAAITEACVRAGTAATHELAEPMIDLIRAKIEYAKSNDDRREFYTQWLEQQDVLIETAETRGKATVSIERTQFELLYLKSERLRIQIERESLN